MLFQTKASKGFILKLPKENNPNVHNTLPPIFSSLDPNDPRNQAKFAIGSIT